MYTTSESDVAKGISRIPLPLARLNQEDLLDFDQLVKDRAEAFDLGAAEIPQVAQSKQSEELDGQDEQSDEDPLNKAFSVLMLQHSEIN